MPGFMLTLGFWERQAMLAWHEWRAPIVAAAVALAAWALARVLSAPRVQAAAAGIGLFVGWAVAEGGVSLVPHLPAERLPVLAAAALVVGVGLDAWGLAAGLAAFVLAVVSGWWLAGAPRSDAEAGLVLPAMACLAMGVMLAQRLLRAPRGPWVTSAAALALWGALAAVATPGPWAGLALVPVGASLGQLAAPRGTASVRLPMAAGLAGLAGLAVLAAGHFGRGGFGRVDLAALAPVLAIWAVPRLERRMPWAGGLMAALAAAALPVGLVWGVARLGLLR